MIIGPTSTERETPRLDCRPHPLDTGDDGPGRIDHGNRRLRRQPVGHRKHVPRRWNPAGPVLSGALFQRADLARVPGRPPGGCRADPSLAGGLDNAWGGAETGDGTSFMGTPNIGTQIAAFLGSGNTLSSTQLVTIWGGANDFLNAGVTDPTIPVANLASEISTLAAAGGKQFLVPNLPLLGELPATNTLPTAERLGLDGLSLAFDGLLAARLTQLQSDLGVTIHQFDVQTIFANILASPGAYGFTNVTTSALGDGVLSADGYFFWDSVHPTTAAQQLIGNTAAALVPEPSSLTLLLAAGCTLIAWRQARGRRQKV